MTKKANEITEALKDSFEASGTIVDAVGGYSKSEFQIIYLIINHFQVNKLKTIVHSIDAQAFVSLHEISDVIRQQENV
ncbi:MAG: YitT family protein [Lachnospiraceae bacterium]|nr:YitT family protein [bacterium]MDY5518102.1 YitT family protein [Lachnospiraceae bacterium]